MSSSKVSKNQALRRRIRLGRSSWRMGTVVVDMGGRIPNRPHVALPSGCRLGAQPSAVAVEEAAHRPVEAVDVRQVGEVVAALEREEAGVGE